MTNQELLRKIYLLNKEMNRNIKHIVNIALFAFFKNTRKEAKKNKDEVGKKIAKIGIFVIFLSELLLLLETIVVYLKGGE